MIRILAIIICSIIFTTINGQNVGLASDSVSCFVLKQDVIDKVALSRPQFVMSSDSMCYLRYIHHATIDSLLNDLEYIRDLEYNTNEFAMEWKVYSDSVIALESMTPPIRALLLIYNSIEKPIKYYTDKHLNYLIWITKETVEIGNREYRLSHELEAELFKSSRSATIGK